MSWWIVWGGLGGTTLEPSQPEDPGDGGDKDEIVVRDPDVYEVLLDGLYDPTDPDPVPVYQLSPGTTELYGPGKDGQYGPQGVVVTQVERPDWPWGLVLEDWIVYSPEATLRGDLELDFRGFGHTVDDTLDEYASLPDAGSYGHLTFKFTYGSPPSASAIAALPTVIPWFVTDIEEFDVETELNGSQFVSGALYRQRTQLSTGATPVWRDVWVLYRDYEFPTAGNGAVTVLKPTGVADRPLRRFLEAQPDERWLFVQASSAADPL
ncbi:MAG: hypothetical protein R3F59_08995 [Myxococcota bacterium]